MSKPLIHAKISVKNFGGNVCDYIEIHNWLDSTKAHIPDARHRLILHNSFGIFLAEQLFGDSVVKGRGKIVRMPYITNSWGRQVSVRDIAEQHVIDDLGYIPTLEECIRNTPLDAAVLSGVMGNIKAGNFKLVD